MGSGWNRVNLLRQMRRFYWCLLACGLLLIAAGLLFLFNPANDIFCKPEEFQLVCDVQLEIAVQVCWLIQEMDSCCHLQSFHVSFIFQGDKHVDRAEPWIHMVTPTYRRPEQLPELTRLSQTLQFVPRLHWIVVEDSSTCSAHLSVFLKKTGMLLFFNCNMD